MTAFAWGSEKAFAKKVTYSNEEQIWKIRQKRTARTQLQGVA